MLLIGLSSFSPSLFSSSLLCWLNYGFWDLGDKFVHFFPFFFVQFYSFFFFFFRGGLGIGSTVLKVLKHPKYSQFTKKIDQYQQQQHSTPPPLSSLFAASEEVNNETIGGAAANGALMRTSIIGVCFYDNLELAEGLAIAFCKVIIF